MRYTPSIITKNNITYTIPIYQRLFEWDSENIINLLDDLNREFEQTENQGDYYIGMLTSTKNHELVDGQQRFTVMMLLGCVLQEFCADWKTFLVVENKPRLDFTSRPLDNTYLSSLIEQKDDEKLAFRNLKMQNGRNEIRNYMMRIEKESHEKASLFASYIFHHLSFFISDLPEGYNPRDLNKYFERMNTSGKNLEQHEILKVKLLSNLDERVESYIQLWNKIADVDTLLIRRRKDENDNSLKDRKNDALAYSINEIIGTDILNGMSYELQENAVSISSIEMSAEKPKNNRESNKDSHCALTFPYLLLQTLYRFLDGKIEGKINDFFKPTNLLEIFEKYLPYNGKNANKENIKSFMQMLLRCRLALDICFIRPTEYGYALDMNLTEDDSDLRNLLMFQSMLYVSSSNYTNYRWFRWLMNVIDSVNRVPEANDLYKSLKVEDDKLNPLLEYEKLSYGDIRYWFWRLDFYIWQHRTELFEKTSPEMSVADNYVFKRNRSIEHIAPQTPQSNSTFVWNESAEDEKLRDSFGNLVMISQGLNSALSNESYEVKIAHVHSYCNGAKSGSIESLKLLVAHSDYPKGWTKEAIVQHCKFKIEVQFSGRGKDKI